MSRNRRKISEPKPDSGLDLPLLNQETDKLLARFCKAMGHPARLAILRRLQEEPNSDCATLVREVQLAQSTVSQHLAVLLREGLIGCRQDGNRTLYAVQEATIRHWRILVASL